MSARILLIRHGAHDLLGQVLCGRTVDVGLNGAGAQQAARLGAALEGQGVAAVHASPLRRARETAGPIAAACGVLVSDAPELAEIDFGGWSGARFDDLAGNPRWQGWNAIRSQQSPPGGESMIEVQARVARWIARIASEGGMVAAVSHADVIKAAICHALGLSVDGHGRFDIDPGSVTTLVAGDWGVKLERLNVPA